MGVLTLDTCRPLGTPRPLLQSPGPSSELLWHKLFDLHVSPQFPRILIRGGRGESSMGKAAKQGRIGSELTGARVGKTPWGMEHLFGDRCEGGYPRLGWSWICR